MDPFIGEIRLFGFTYAPEGWLLCDGSSVSENQLSALSAVIGTNYGGNDENFNLPNLQGQVPMHWGTGPGLTPRAYSSSGGTPFVPLTSDQMPVHTHSLTGMRSAVRTNAPTNNSYLSRTFGQLNYGSGAANTQMAPAQIANTGSGTAHENRQPFLVLNFCIATTGVFPVKP